MIKRKIAAEIAKSMHYFPAIGIIGPRQVGKTTLAKALQKQLEKPSIYLDLELDFDGGFVIYYKHIDILLP